VYVAKPTQSGEGWFVPEAEVPFWLWMRQRLLHVVAWLIGIVFALMFLIGIVA
jgi:hypothetical protein